MKPCCDNPIITTTAPHEGDKQETVAAVCGNCGKDYGEMALSDAAKLNKRLHRTP